MRAVILALLVAVSIGFIATSNASAAPGGNAALVKPSHNLSDVIQVRDGCGYGWHRNAFGVCHRNWRWHWHRHWHRHGHWHGHRHWRH